MRALLAGARGETVDTGADHPRGRQHARLATRSTSPSRARRSSSPSEKSHRRPHGASSIPTRSTPRATACAPRSAPRLREPAAARPRSGAAGRRRSQPRGQGRPPAARRGARPARRRRPARGRRAGQGAVRRGRQHDRPPGRAGDPGVARRARTAGGARRFLRPLPATIRWCIDKWFALQASAQRRDTDRRGRAARRAPGVHHRQPQPPARAGRQLRGQPMGVPPRVGARLPLRRRHDPRRRQA